MKIYSLGNEAVREGVHTISTKEKSRCIFSLFIAIFSFLLATSIYLFVRDTSNLLYRASVLAGLAPQVDSIRGIMPILPGCLVYSMPDALWMLSFSLLIITIWGFQRSREALAWIAIALLTGMIMESLQALAILPGRFDLVDLAFIISAALLPLWFTHKSISNEKT